MTSYPNLELLEYKAKQLLAQDEEFLTAVEAYKKENNTKYARYDLMRHSMASLKEAQGRY